MKVKIKTPSSLTAAAKAALRGSGCGVWREEAPQTEKEKSIIDKIVDEVKGAVQ